MSGGASSSSAQIEKKSKVKYKTNAKRRYKTRDESGDATQQQLSPGSSCGTRRNRSPGVRLVGSRIYDSQNGKTCHQCRQKTMDFVASCKSRNEKNQCTFHFCHKCLLNRYGENAEEVAVLNDWMCPKCRGICNCSFCMKKRGDHPTGILVHVAKANGFSSVSEMLQLGSENSGSKETGNVGTSLKKLKASEKEPVAALSKKCRKGNCLEGDNDMEVQAKPVKTNGKRIETRNSKFERLRNKNADENAPRGNKVADSLSPKSSPLKCRISKVAYEEKDEVYRRDGGHCLVKINSDLKVFKKNSRESIKNDYSEIEILNNVDIDDAVAKQSQHCKKNMVGVQGKAFGIDIPLPQGIVLNSIASIDLPPEDVGHALQLLEFCEAFGEVLSLKKGQPELLLRELACRRSKRRPCNSSIVQFHIQLLSVVLKDSGKEYRFLNQNLGGNSWLQALVRYISESQYPLKELQLDCFDVGIDGYDLLDSSKKLRLLNFLCDEALGTTDFRNWIDEQNSKFIEREKEAKEKLLAEREKEKNMERSMKKKLQDEIAKAVLMKMGVPLSISEHEDLISKIKSEVAQTLARTLEESNAVIEKEHRSDAVRSEPILLDGHGRKFWRLRGYCSEMDILLQDVEKGDFITYKERWYTYDIGQKTAVERYTSSFRKLSQ